MSTRNEFTELSVSLSTEEGANVELELKGLEWKYNLYLSTPEVAVRDLRAAADWIEQNAGRT